MTEFFFEFKGKIQYLILTLLISRDKIFRRKYARCIPYGLVYKNIAHKNSQNTAEV